VGQEIAPPIRRRGYAILAGGGVKGIALVGALVAAQEFGFDFCGFAGTSAGSMVSLLACLGYSGRQIADILERHPIPGAFLDDDSNRLTTYVKNLQRSGVTLGTLRNGHHPTARPDVLS
jgi:NTE family protein